MVKLPEQNLIRGVNRERQKNDAIKKRFKITGNGGFRVIPSLSVFFVGNNGIHNKQNQQIHPLPVSL
jgi:hypothetical protein